MVVFGLLLCGCFKCKCDEQRCVYVCMCNDVFEKGRKVLMKMDDDCCGVGWWWSV